MNTRNRRSDRPRNRQHLSFDSLESRQLLSLGAESPVNTQKAGDQFESASAGALVGGMTVTAWTTTFTPTDHDIHAQLYRADGTQVGSEITLAGSGKDDREPAVAISRDGNFVLAWTETQPGGDTNVLARRFSPTGNQVGPTVQVGVGTFKEHDPSVAVDLDGRFVVSYTRDTDGTNPDVFAKRFDANGQLLGLLSVGTSGKAESHSSVAVSPRSGDIDVAFQLAFSASDDDVLLSRFSASGQALSTTAVANSGAREQAPSLSMDFQGLGIVAYQKQVGSSFDVKARRIGSAGSVGPEINVAGTADDEVNPSVALRNRGGEFVVAYERIRTIPPVLQAEASPTAVGSEPVVSVGQAAPSRVVPVFPWWRRSSVNVKEFSAAGQEVAWFDAGQDRGKPSVAFKVTYGAVAADTYLVTYTDLAGNAADPGKGIRGRRGHL